MRPHISTPALLALAATAAACSVDTGIGDYALRCGDRGECPPGLECDRADQRCRIPRADAGGADGGATLDGGVLDGGPAQDGGAVDGGATLDGGDPDGGTAPDGGFLDGGAAQDGGDPDGGAEIDGGVLDGAVSVDGGSDPDGGATGDGGITADGGVDGGSPFIVGAQVAAGGFFSCAIATGPLAEARCWGDNGYGQLGNATEVTSGVPVQTDSPPLAQAVTAGAAHACVVTAARRVSCWGRNSDDEVGDASLVHRNLPVELPLNDVWTVAAGTAHTCAISGGDVYCWGANQEAQLGPTVSGPHSMGPARVPLAMPASRVAAGGSHSCAILVDGTVACWGANGAAQLGTPISSASATPVPVAGLARAREIAAGTRHTCALLDATGEVHCWGEGSEGQLGSGDAPASRSTPLAVRQTNGAVLAGAIRITAGHNHTCAAGNEVNVGFSCWGDNRFGQVGGLVEQKVLRARRITLASMAFAISAGQEHTCFMVTGPRYFCFGSNTFGQLGTGERFRPQPQRVVGFEGPAGSVAAGGRHTCSAAEQDGGIVCWGDNAVGQIGMMRGELYDGTVSHPSLPNGDATAVFSGHQFSCARTTASAGVACWGYNNEGQLLQPVESTGLSSTPLDTGLSGVVDLALGYEHACMVQVASVGCWGSNARGQLSVAADGGARSSTVIPVGVAASSRVAAGGAHSCAVLSGAGAGRVMCWGAHEYGQLGVVDARPRIDTPVEVSSLSGVSEISAGDGHTCVILGDGGAVRCWGANRFGQLGNNMSTDSQTPVAAIGLTDARALALGGNHACALTAGGEVKCWGNNENGQSGGTTTGLGAVIRIAGSVPGAPLSVAIGARAAHTCAASADGGIYCWGVNYNGQLGDGEPVFRTTPVEVAPFP